MPTYVYETIPTKKGAKRQKYEIRQSILDAALTRHPETGEPIRRVIAGNTGLFTGLGSSAASSHRHTSACGCGAGH